MTLNDPNPDFKVSPFFDAEYFQNGYRYGDSYTMKGEQETVPKLSNATTFNDLE